MFHIGQLVVCVDDTPAMLFDRDTGKTYDHQNLLKKGRVYTIRNLKDWNFYTGPALGIWLEEVIRNDAKGPDKPFGAVRFRPVKQTSIDCFTALLTKTPELVDN